MIARTIQVSGVTQSELSRQGCPGSLTPGGGKTDELFQLGQQHWPQANRAEMIAVDRVRHINPGLPGLSIHRRVENAALRSLPLADGIDHHLLEHPPGQGVGPEVAIFGIQDGADSSLAGDDIIRPGGGSPLPAGVMPGVIPQHALEPLFLSHLVTGQVLPEEPGQQGLKETVHVEQQPRQRRGGRLAFQENSPGLHQQADDRQRCGVGRGKREPGPWKTLFHEFDRPGRPQLQCGHGSRPWKTVGVTRCEFAEGWVTDFERCDLVTG